MSTPDYDVDSKEKFKQIQELLLTQARDKLVLKQKLDMLDYKALETAIKIEREILTTPSEDKPTSVNINLSATSTDELKSKAKTILRKAK